MLRPWWEQFPERLEYERQALGENGITLLNEVRNETRLNWTLQHNVDGRDLTLVVRFPDLYPYTRFEVFAPDLELPRHKNPFESNLCLIADPTNNWSSSDTVADFIVHQLPRVLEAATSPDQGLVADLEAHQGEPFSSYYRYLGSSMLLIDSAWTIPADVPHGKLEIGVFQDPNTIRGSIMAVQDASGNSLAQIAPSLSGFKKTVKGRWVRLSSPIRAQTGDEFAKALFSIHPEFRHLRWQTFGLHQIDVIGVVFPEELAWRQTADGWVFLIGFKGTKGKRDSFHLVRAGRAGIGDMQQRVPELTPLRHKTVAVCGLGCIGAPSAIEFARAGVGSLRILDDDFVEPGTTVRWPLGFRHAGVSKAVALHQFISGEYPFTAVRAYDYRIGSTPESGDADIAVLRNITEQADLLYDATAERNIQRLLSEVARSLRLPFVSVSATAGGWGGLVVQIRPDSTAGCWNCLQHSLTDGTIPVPPFKPDGWVEPQGCNSPSFTGANFDLGNIPLAGVRLSVATLCSGQADSYPDFDWDVAVLSLRNESSSPIAPTWKTFQLIRHSQCTNH